MPLCLELAMLPAALRCHLNLEVSGSNTRYCGSGLLTHQAIMAEQVLPAG